jgi:hypothetical protein
MKNNIEIISLIYKSNQYLHFILNELIRQHEYIQNYKVGIRIVGNNPEPHVEQEMLKMSRLFNPNTVTFDIYKDPKPDDYYLNRVYRCYNYAGSTSKYDNICFVNSDMAFEQNWLINLLKHHNGQNIPCSRLIESARMPSGKYGISYNCGQTLKEFNRVEFLDACQKAIQPNAYADGGLFMPCIFEKKRFVESGMYPEGNIYDTGVGTRIGNLLHSGDYYYFEEILSKKYNMKHITVFDSLSYHFQEGEKGE